MNITLTFLAFSGPSGSPFFSSRFQNALFFGINVFKLSHPLIISKSRFHLGKSRLCGFLSSILVLEGKSTISDDYFSSGLQATESAIVSSDETIVNHCIFFRCSSKYGGGIMSSHCLEFRSCCFDLCRGFISGQAVFAIDGNITGNHSTIVRCSKPSSPGNQSPLVFRCIQLSLRHFNVSHNYVTQSVAIILVQSFRVSFIDFFNMYQNKDGFYGGSLYFYKGDYSTELSYGNIVSNPIMPTYSLIWIDSIDTHIVFSKCIFMQNTPGSYVRKGLMSGLPHFRNCIFDDESVVITGCQTINCVFNQKNIETHCLLFLNTAHCENYIQVFPNRFPILIQVSLQFTYFIIDV